MNNSASVVSEISQWIEEIPHVSVYSKGNKKENKNKENYRVNTSFSTNSGLISLSFIKDITHF